MTLLLRIAGIGIAGGVITLIALQFPPFPTQFGAAITSALSFMFAFDVLLPVKLAFNLVLVSWLISVLVISMRIAIWLTKTVLGTSS